MSERNSERTIIWAVIIIIGLRILGVDVKEILAIVSQANDAAEQVRSATGIRIDELVLGGSAGLYTWCRTRLKEVRETVTERVQ